MCVVETTSTPYHEYSNPLVERYASRDMSWLFSPQYKFQTWRRLWVALAEAEAEAGLDISQAQIDELRAHIEEALIGSWGLRLPCGPSIFTHFQAH